MSRIDCQRNSIARNPLMWHLGVFIVGPSSVFYLIRYVHVDSSYTRPSLRHETALSLLPGGWHLPAYDGATAIRCNLTHSLLWPPRRVRSHNETTRTSICARTAKRAASFRTTGRRETVAHVFGRTFALRQKLLKHGQSTACGRTISKPSSCADTRQWDPVAPDGYATTLRHSRDH